MSQQGFQLAVAERVARITLDVPPGNILSTALQLRLADSVHALAARMDVNVLVLESAVGGKFSTGADVAEHLGRENVTAMLRSARRLLAELLRFPVPTMACVNGACLGGGFELLLACDHWHVGPQATFGLPEITLGCFPPAALVLAPQKLPQPLAAEMILSGRVLNAEEFCRRAGCALATDSAAAASTFAALPRGVLAQTTRLLRPGAAERFEAQIGAVEAAYLEELLPLADASEGPRAFLAKQKPHWNHQSSV